MTLEQVLEKIKDIPSLVDAVEVDELIDHVSGWLQEKEEELALVDQQVSQKRLELVEKHGTVNKANLYLEVEPIYISQQEIERRIRQLKSARSNLKRRYEIIQNRFLSRYY